MSYYEELLAKKGIRLSDACRAARNNVREPLMQGRRRLPKTERIHIVKQPVVMDGVRICSTCHEAKPVSEYHLNKNKKDGRDARCKPCKKVFMQQWYKKRQVAA